MRLLGAQRIPLKNHIKISNLLKQTVPKHMKLNKDNLCHSTDLVEEYTKDNSKSLKKLASEISRF